MAFINGIAYSYSNIAITLAGVQLATATSIEYKETQEKVNQYGLGEEPYGRGRGVKEYSGSLELSLGEAQKLREAVKKMKPESSGSLTDLPPFDIIVSFDNGEKLITHRLLFCEFTEDGVSGSQGDTELKYSLPIVIGKIIFEN